MQNLNISTRVFIVASVFLSALAALAEYLLPVFMGGMAVYALVVFSFVFDVIFTALFVSDLAEAARRKEAGYYMLHGRGVLDFSSSVLVLVLFSAPSVIVIAAGADSAAVRFMKNMAWSWNMLCVTGVLRVSRVSRLASLPLMADSVLSERLMTTACNIICGVSVLAAAVCGFVMRMATSGFPYYHVDRATGFISAAVLLAILSGVIFLYLRHFNRTVSSVLDLLDRGFRRREFYLKLKVDSKRGDDAISRIASFYNETYLPAKMKQNVNSPGPAVYRVPEEDVKNFIRSR